MKRIFKYGIIAFCMALTVPALTSCDNNDYDTNQYVGGVNLNSFGPSPVARGGQLRFLGSGMNQITKITIPGSGDITDIEVVSNEEIRITVPQDAEPGILTLHHAGGMIQTKTMLTYLEPISIDGITPLRVKPGETIAIKGEYLNLIKEVCFSFTEGMDSVNVYAPDFIAHDRKGIELTVPAEAISGPIFLSDAKEMPNMIKSEMVLDIVVPAPVEVETLASVKGGDKVTVKGSDFDLVKEVLVPGDEKVEFVYTPGEAAGEDVIEFVIPENTPDGAVKAVTSGGVEVVLVNIGMAEPTDMVATPAADIRGGQTVTIKGLNLDQVASVSLPNVESPVTPTGVSNGELTFVYPEEAHSGDAVLNLKSGKTASIHLAAALPEVTGFNPTTVPAGSEVTIHGRNLDLAHLVYFNGVEEGIEVKPASASEFSVAVPALAKSGAVVDRKSVV